MESASLSTGKSCLGTLETWGNGPRWPWHPWKHLGSPCLGLPAGCPNLGRVVVAIGVASFFALGFVEPGVAQRVELRGWSAAMPIFTFLAVAAYALIALLFVADATLEHSGSPVIATSQRTGLPERQRPDGVQTLIARPAPAPDMASHAVLAAQPKSAPDDLEKIGSAARAARAEAPPKDRRVTQPIGYHRTPSFDRFSIKGY